MGMHLERVEPSRGSFPLRVVMAQGASETFSSMDGIERHAPEVSVGRVLEGHRHLLGLAVDQNMAEELQPHRGGQILTLLFGRCLDEFELRAEGVVERVGAKRACMQRP